MLVNKRGFADAMFLSVSDAFDLEDPSIRERKLKRSLRMRSPNENYKRDRDQQRYTNETPEDSCHCGRFWFGNRTGLDCLHGAGYSFVIVSSRFNSTRQMTV